VRLIYDRLRFLAGVDGWDEILDDRVLTWLLSGEQPTYERIRSNPDG
jgi:hypothetical protein